MKLKVIIHEAEEGGYWAEVPFTPGCATQGESFDEFILQNADPIWLHQNEMWEYIQTDKDDREVPF